MHRDATNRAAWRSRLIDARLGAAETTNLERMIECGVDRELAVDLLLLTRRIIAWYRGR